VSFTKIVERKVFRTTSGSYAIILPKDWIQSLREINKKDVDRLVIIVGKFLVITPIPLRAEDLGEIITFLRKVGKYG